MTRDWIVQFFADDGINRTTESIGSHQNKMLEPVQTVVTSKSESNNDANFQLIYLFNFIN
jgi:hypothetical protein